MLTHVHLAKLLLPHLLLHLLLLGHSHGLLLHTELLLVHLLHLRHLLLLLHEVHSHLGLLLLHVILLLEHLRLGLLRWLLGTEIIHLRLETIHGRHTSLALSLHGLRVESITHREASSSGSTCIILCEIHLGLIIGRGPQRVESIVVARVE